MNGETLLLEITKPEHRHDPYPLYAQARELRVCRQHDGAYLVASHREVSALLHDPRVSSDPRKSADPPPPPPALPFIYQDATDHDRLRRTVMDQFGPPDHAGLVAAQEPDIAARVDELLAGLVGRDRIDIVDELAYPLPVAVICRLLGVPAEDESRFRSMADALVRTAGALDMADAAELLELKATTRMQLAGYLLELIARHRAEPGDNLLSRLANDTSSSRMADLDLAATGALLLLAGHETTVNLIANGTLMMLRHPELFERLRSEPDIALRVVEELLRMEPPVQYLPTRVALTEIEVLGTTIPKGSRIILLLAAANRDPELFVNPDKFDPDRTDCQHFGFGGGIHYCFGAPLARLEGQVVLTALARSLQNPRLTVDPPPYRPSPVLRGPIHLEVDVDAVVV